MPFKTIPPLYSIWQGMKGRCLNPNSKPYPDYGGRGIRVCERWMHDYAAFEADMGERPSPRHTLDRINNDGDYTPENCRWATKKTQQRNQRRAVYVVVEGIKYRAIELAEKAGVSTETIKQRAKRGLSYEEVIFSGKLKPDYSTFIPDVIAKAKATKAARKTCRKGHLYTEENTRLTKEGWRSCRTCHNEKMRRYKAAKRQA